MAIVSIGDFAKNLKTGHMGKVIGYSHQMLNDVYQTTVKVLITDSKGEAGQVEEDIIAVWQPIESEALNAVA